MMYVEFSKILKRAIVQNTSGLIMPFILKQICLSKKLVPVLRQVT